jgi:hypothetical protein
VVGLKVPENFMFYLSAHEQCTKKLLAKAKDLTAVELEISPEPEIVRMRKMVYGVRTEVHRMRGFVRLKPLGSHVLYGYLKPRHKIGSYIAERFARKNPGVIIVLGHSSESWISLYIDDGGRMFSEHDEGLIESLEKIKSALGCFNDCEDAEDIWNVYYQSQYCAERRNIEAFHRRMPKKALASAGSVIEQNKNRKTLGDFFSLE